jgi:hypothetical protein
MVSEAHIVVRPRSTGEVLDDAWRIVLSRPVFLLALTLPFTVPWAAALIILLTHSASAGLGGKMLLPAIVALLLPLTGVGAGACQEAFRRLVEGKSPSLGECICSACRRGFQHATARAAAWGGALIATVCVVMPGLIVWVGTSSVHAVLAEGTDNWLGALTRAGRESQRYPAKALVVTFARPVVLLFAAMNVHLLGQGLLWAAGTLVGLDLPRVAVLATLGNPLYDTVLLLFCWLLLVPYGEAVSYLLHQDARARFEGLDLQYRVQQVFPIRPAAKAGAALVALTIVLTCAGTAAADQRTTIGHARQEVTAIADEMDTAQPFPGAKHWVGRLEVVAKELDQAAGPHGCRWFREGIAGFAGRNQADAIRVVHDLKSRLDVWDADLAREAAEAGGPPALSKNRIKSLLPRAKQEETEPEPEAQPKPKPRRKPHHGEDGDGVVPETQSSGGSGLVVHTHGGFGKAGWFILVGLVGALLIYGIANAILNWKKAAQTKPAVQVKPVEPSLESLLTEPDPKMIQGLWRQADELAGRGQFLEATRALYLAVLALLHGAGLIRYERVRTNHEYVAQLRPRETVQRPFVRLTGLFEVKWYGERACRPDDFAACRELAEQIRNEARA